MTVHVIGIGGAGMSGIARILLARGERVTGSDARESAAVLALRALGAEVHVGHDPAHLPEPPATVVVSTAIRESNPELAAALPGLVDAGIAVLHAHGKAGAPAGPAAGYVGLPYIDAMDLAYAAADAVLGRCGAMTVAEVSAVGLPAVYVPLPHGNGEQALNAAPVVAAGGGVLVPDAELTGERVLAELVPLLTDPARLAATGAAARRSGHADAAERLAHLVLDVARTRKNTRKNTGGEAA